MVLVKSDRWAKTCSRGLWTKTATDMRLQMVGHRLTGTSRAAFICRAIRVGR